MATKSAEEYAYALGMIDDGVLFGHLFNPLTLLNVYTEHFSKSAGKGIDRRNGFQFSPFSMAELTVASNKCLAGAYRFSPYLENLKTKGRNKLPRLIGIPTIRDRIILHQLNRFLACVFPTCVPKSVASTYVRQISNELAKKSPDETWVCGTDIEAFYDNVVPERLLKALSKKVTCWQALRLIRRSLRTPTVPKDSRRNARSGLNPSSGVPQGLAISNILASIYMQDVDKAMREGSVTYYRYVDDVLMYGNRDDVEKSFHSLRDRLKRRGLTLHPLSSGKSFIRSIRERFGYLGYEFMHPEVTVRESTVERLLQSIAAMFSSYVHNKKNRLAKYTYLDEGRLAEIFLMELNERITGAISERQRYGWIAYFGQITDLRLLHRIDATIGGFFIRLDDFGNRKPVGLQRLSRAYFEMKFNPEGAYVRNYDVITSRPQKLEFLIKRGRIGPAEALTDEQISDRFDRYRKKILSDMHADEGVMYG